MKTVTMISTVSAASSVNSAPIEVADVPAYAIQVVFTGSNVVGTLKLQGSIDGTSYEDIISQAVTASTNAIFDRTSRTGMKYARLSWTYTSGTGNITVTGNISESIVRGA
jgi:hypothetical protein